MITITPTLHFDGHTPVRAVLHIDNDQKDGEGMSLEVTARSSTMLAAQASQFQTFISNTTTNDTYVKPVEKDYISPWKDTHENC